MVQSKILDKEIVMYCPDKVHRNCYAQFCNTHKSHIICRDINDICRKAKENGEYMAIIQRDCPWDYYDFRQASDRLLQYGLSIDILEQQEACGWAYINDDSCKDYETDDGESAYLLKRITESEREELADSFVRWKQYNRPTVSKIRILW